MREVYVQLGRYGDILGFLPVLHHKYIVTGHRPRLVVSRDFEDVLDGVTYVDRIVFPGDRDDLGTALRFARPHGRVINAQVKGDGVTTHRTTECFMRDSWAMVGVDKRWDTLSLILDARDAQAEQELADEVLPVDPRPVVLVAAGSHSSPFNATALDQVVRDLSRDFAVVDITRVRARRLYDLLGLFDRAHALITVDTSVLHLADASNIPVCALVNPRPWYGSLPRANHIYYSAYDRIDPAAMCEAIRGMLPKARNYVHVYPTWPGMDAATKARQVMAAKSWKALPSNWRHFGHCPKRTSEEIGDHADLPFVHDMIEHGMRKCKHDDDVVVLTNSDIGLVPETHGYLNALMNRGAGFGYRFNHARIATPLARMDNLRGRWDGGLDLFAFTRGFWSEFKGEFPDMVMGAPKWDLVYRDIIKRLDGGELHGCAWHEVHRSRWQDDPHPVSTKHNERIWAKFTSRNDPTRCYL